MGTVPKGNTKIIINDVSMPISHLNLGLPNITRLKNNVGPVLTLIGSRRKWSRSASIFGRKNDYLGVDKLSWLLHTSA